MTVKAQMAKWGNSLAVRIPKQVADRAAFQEGDVLVLEVEDEGQLAIKAEKRPPTINELVAKITPQNLHKVEDWDGPVGNETW